MAAVSRQFDGLLAALPAARRDMFEAVAAELRSAVRRNIGGSGKVGRWQEKYVGSGGGYAAVRPAADTWAESGKNRYAVGYVTNAVENGHVQRKGRFVPALGKRLARDRVEGKYFYADTRRFAEALAVRRAKEFLEELERRLAV